MSTLESLNIPAWGSDEALRKEEHVARFLEREYKAAADNPVSLDDLGISASMGAMWEETGELIETHYDERIEFFESFLDSSFRAYSMAYYGENKNEVMKSSLSLEEAQANKFRLICDRIGIQGNEKILNVGCGFGSFERYILQHYPGIHVTGITPSKVQATYLEHCLDDPKCVLKQENFSLIMNSFSLIQEDTLELGAYDLVISIGLLEHVRNMESFNKKVFEILKPNGKSFHHFIVSKFPISQLLDSKETLIGDYFPGGRVWPHDEFIRHNGLLQLEGKWFVNGVNYWKTLDEWHRRFWINIDFLSGHLDGARINYWNDYFILSKACFRPLSGTAFGNGHYLFRKPK